MLSDVFDDSAMVRILDVLLDLVDPNTPFTQKDICENTEVKISRPTAVKAFKIMLRDGMIKKVRGGYKVIWGEKAPMTALLQFDMRICFHQVINENRRKAKLEIEKDKKRKKSLYKVVK
jgi:predicted transcriptional regulator